MKCAEHVSVRSTMDHWRVSCARMCINIIESMYLQSNIVFISYIKFYWEVNYKIKMSQQTTFNTKICYYSVKKYMHINLSVHSSQFTVCTVSKIIVSKSIRSPNRAHTDVS